MFIEKGKTPFMQAVKSLAATVAPLECGHSFLANSLAFLERTAVIHILAGPFIPDGLKARATKKCYGTSRPYAVTARIYIFKCTLQKAQCPKAHTISTNA